MTPVKLEVGKFYKDGRGDTIDIYKRDEDGHLWGIWVEQALEEPNHAHLLYHESGQMVDLETAEELSIVREITELETARLQKIFKARRSAP